MPIRKKAKPGDYLRVCDRTGFVAYATDTKKEWNNLIVRKDVWEARQPQDFVRGRMDKQASREPRPRTVDIFGGPLTTEINATHPAGTQVLTVLDATRLVAGDTVRITHDDHDIGVYLIQSVDDGFTVTLVSALRGSVSAGNAVVNISAVSTVTL